MKPPAGTFRVESYGECQVFTYTSPFGAVTACRAPPIVSANTVAVNPFARVRPPGPALSAAAESAVAARALVLSGGSAVAARSRGRQAPGSPMARRRAAAARAAGRKYQ